ncbi:MAG: amidohydrolase family protein [Gemmatimonadota bacterium]
MLRIPCICALLLIAGLQAEAAAQDEGSETLAIRGVTVIDGTGAPGRPGSTVLIRDRRIVAVGPDQEIAPPPGARVLEGEGRYLIPALWDMHTHLSKARAPALPLLVANGVLGVRDVGGDMDELFRWEEEIRAGERTGPRIVMAGPYLESASNVLRVLMEGTVEPEERTRIPIANPEDARRVVDSIAGRGVDLVKVRTWPDLETFRAIADAAADHGLPLAAHTFGLPPEDLREGAVASIEHFYPVPEDWTEVERQSFYEELAGNGTLVVSTLVVLFESLLVPDSLAARIVADPSGSIDDRRRYVSAFLLADWEEQLPERSPQAVQNWKEYYPAVLQILQEMQEAGVPLLPGTDLGVLLIFPGSSLHRELELLVEEVGLTPMEALESATRHPVESMGLADSLGTIEAGKIADLVLLEGDPLEDIANTRRIAAVIQEGRLYAEEDLDRMREQVLAMPELKENDWIPKPPSLELRAAQAVAEALDQAGSAEDVALALERFQALEGAERLPGGHPALAARIEAAVNQAGYRLLAAERGDEAVAVFKLNTETFPDAFNTWDSLAEAYLSQGDRESAIRFYRKSLELNPANQNAREQLEELGEAVVETGGATQPAGQPQPAVEYLANEGVLVTGGDAAIVIDGLFGDGLPEYPVVPAAIRDSLETALGRFSEIDLVLVTHRHDDHFDPAAVTRHLEANPEAILVAPGDALAAFRPDQLERYGERLQPLDLPPGSYVRLDVGGFAVEALGLAHAETGHVGYRIELPGLTVLHLGDSEPAPADLATFLEGRPGPEVALVPYWVLSGSRGGAIVEAIGADCTAAFHLEREVGDIVARLAEQVPSVAVLDEPGERLVSGC